MNLHTPTLTLLLLLLTPFFASCSTSAKFRPVGGAIHFNPDLPAPDDPDVEPNTLTIRLSSGELLEDDEFAEELRDNLIEAAGRSGQKISRRKDKSKKAHYELTITELALEGSFEGNAEGAVYSSLALAIIGAAATKKAEGAVMAGLGGAALGFLSLGEKRSDYALEVRYTQRTSAEGMATIRSKSQKNGTIQSQTADDFTGNSIAAGDVDTSAKMVVFDTRSHTFSEKRYLNVIGLGGAFTSSEERADAAKRIMARRLARWIFPRDIY